MLAAAGTTDSNRRVTPTRLRDRNGSASKSNIMAIDESATSLVDFDLSESKFTMGGFLDRTAIDAGTGDKTETEMPSAIKPSELQKKLSNPALNNSGRLNRSSGGGPDDDFALSLDESDFGLSQSNFSAHKFDQFSSGVATNSGVSSTKPANKMNLYRDRASTLAEKKSSIMHKNLIAEEDDELVSESGLGASNKKKSVL